MQLDPRILRISVETDGVVKTFQDLAMTARGSKTTGAVRNECEVSITNLTRETRNDLLTATSPFIKSRSRRRLIVEAGRERDGVFRLFEGEVTSASPTQPPDIALTLQAQTGAFHAGVIVARSGSAIERLSAIAQRVASDLGATLEFEAEDKQVANWAFQGAALRQVDRLNDCGVDAYLDDDKLVVKDRGAPLRNRSRLLTKDTGMVGIPEVTERGIRVTCLLDRNLTLGGVIEVESELNPSVNGAYTVFKLDFDVANRENAFYHTIEASRR